MLRIWQSVLRDLSFEVRKPGPLNDSNTEVELVIINNGVSGNVEPMTREQLWDLFNVIGDFIADGEHWVMYSP